MTSYIHMLKEKGISMSQLNKGSKEIALEVEDAFTLLELMKMNSIGTLGGDIVIEKDGKLKYAYQIWGSEFIYLNWSCDRQHEEKQEDYAIRSSEVATKKIIEANQIAKKKNGKCLIVLVFDSKIYQLDHSCRVCGLYRDILPWGNDDNTPSGEICPCCGVEFGKEDSAKDSVVAYRKRWLNNGAEWFMAKEKPANWSLEDQLKTIPSEYR